MICAAAGALPDTTRDFSTVIAASPPPPATAKSFQVWPFFCIDALSSAAALASPPEVHQCSTSTSPARTGADRKTPAIASSRDLRIIDMRLSSLDWARFCIERGGW